MSQEQMAPGCEHARCVCWLTQIKNILVTLVLFPLYTALMFSAEKQKQNYYIHGKHIYTGLPAELKKKSYPMPSQPNFLLKSKILPFDKKAVSDHISVLTKELLSLGLLQFWQLCSAEPGCSSQPVTTLSRDTTLSFLNNKTKMNYAQASSNCG